MQGLQDYMTRERKSLLLVSASTVLEGFLGITIAPSQNDFCTTSLTYAATVWRPQYLPKVEPTVLGSVHTGVIASL